MVLRSSTKSASGVSASASVTTCASLLTLSRVNLTVIPSFFSPQSHRDTEEVRTILVSLCFCVSVVNQSLFSQHGLVLPHQLALHLAEHFLVVRSAATHFVRVGFENDAHLVVD